MFESAIFVFFHYFKFLIGNERETFLMDLTILADPSAELDSLKDCIFRVKNEVSKFCQNYQNLLEISSFRSF
jgi:hypothetical protein